MIDCPYCGYANVKKAVSCEECNADLTHIDAKKSKKYISLSLLNKSIKDLEPSQPICIESYEKIRSAIKLMQENYFGCLLVVQKEKMIGILSERDLLYKVALREKEILDQEVHTIMTSNPICLEDKDTVVFALNKMSVGGFRHIPILKNSKPVGMISIRDVLRYLCQNQ